MLLGKKPSVAKQNDRSKESREKGGDERGYQGDRWGRKGGIPEFSKETAVAGTEGTRTWGDSLERQ